MHWYMYWVGTGLGMLGIDCMFSIKFPWWFLMLFFAPLALLVGDMLGREGGEGRGGIKLRGKHS